MLTRILEFPPTPTGRTDFRLCFEAFRGRDPAKCVKEERQYLAQLQRALESISEPIGELPEDADLDGRFRKLNEDGGTISLPQKVFVKLEEYIADAPFMAGVSAQVEDCKDRLSASKQLDVDSPEGQPQSTAEKRRSRTGLREAGKPA